MQIGRAPWKIVGNVNFIYTFSMELRNAQRHEIGINGDSFIIIADNSSNGILPIVRIFPCNCKRRIIAKIIVASDINDRTVKVDLTMSAKIFFFFW
jgi:hypothetical protein